MKRRIVQKLGSLVCLAGILLAAHGAQAQAPSYQAAYQPDGPLFSPEQMRQGISMTTQECAAYRSTVYVVASGVGLCFRYYLSTAGGQSSDVVYFLQGDHPDDKLAYDPEKLDRTAETMSRSYRRPAVYLARMGTDGSSGSHRYRRTWFEVEATHLAIDAINARHGFQSIHVMGQSGGGHLTGALVGTRADIGCAVPGSGRLAFDRNYEARQARRPSHQRHYSPDTALAEVVRHSWTTRILVVTDPADRRVPSHMQTGFVQEVQQAGGRISQFFIAATDDLRHGSTPYVRKAMAGCLGGKSDAEITAALDQMSRERWAAKIAGAQRPAAAPGPMQSLPNPPLPQTGPASRYVPGPAVAAGPAILAGQGLPALR